MNQITELIDRAAALRGPRPVWATAESEAETTGEIEATFVGI
jgi:hypothetical protein